jgi:8-oxo-dGTP pyrophosphatase MutT (NUDIX family)
MLDLKKHVPRGRVSTGLLGRYQENYVWAISREAYWHRVPQGTLMGIVGVGGGQEKGETLTGAVEREAMEEADSRISIAGAGRTVWAYGSGRAKTVDLKISLAGEPAPLLIWQAPMNYLGSKGEPRVTDYICAVYQAEFLDRPRRTTEVTGLMFCGIEDFRAMLREPVSLQGILARGGGYDGLPIPEDACFELHGSPMYLARHWDLLQFGVE